MNLNIVSEALKQIDKEIMSSPTNAEELEELRKLLLFKVMFIESMQAHRVAA